MENLYIVIPAYNEADNIEQCVNDWYPIVQAYNGEGTSRLVIINDGSKDHTYEKLVRLSETRPLLVPLTRENGGHGPTVLFGYQFAIDRKADWVFQTDSDCQTNPHEFQSFWEKRNDYEAIIGYRPVREDGKGRKFVENMVCFLLKLIFGIKVKDSNAPFRLMRCTLVDQYIHKLPKNYDFPNIMLTAYFVYFKHHVLFLPISFKARSKGKSSFHPPKIVRIGWKAIGDFRRFRKEIDAE